ncbi:uncharacterized protein [Palaemon carinicauda]|uniref:uncharacterized protein n=1 Tax=Palaemon carinicauda TaxID=392227 RepID=UPI0035B618AD
MATINESQALVVFLDLEKAFELASAAAILISLVRKRVTGHLLSWVQEYTQGREARVTFQGATSPFLPLENGTPQGEILSPFLFNVLVENLLLVELLKGLEVFIYADDICILKTVALTSIATTSATNVYYTDGSLDMNLPAAGSAVFTSTFSSGWRLSDHASILQAELYAIAKALENSLSKYGHTTIHTASRGAIQRILKRKFNENIFLISSIKAMVTAHALRSRKVTLKWIPSHVGIHGNDEADRLANSAPRCLTVLNHWKTTLYLAENPSPSDNP